MNSPEELNVFTKIHAMVLKVYKITKQIPSEERFGLISQIRRAAVSIPSNLLEGANRLNSKEYRQFVGISRGSAAELKYQLLLSKDLGYLSEDIFNSINEEIKDISRMLYGLAKSLEKKSAK
ncbi:MAG: four helix bundle protein [Nitrospirae bacterium]|nr:four helix bundle protein [Nitrospirota bacterium]